MQDCLRVRRKPSVERIGRMIHILITNLRNFAADQAGATAIEYSLIAAAVFLGIVPLINAMHGQMANTYQTILSYFAAI